jgi:hypothetical protein
MRKLCCIICCAALLLAAGCAANSGDYRSESSIRWGQTVDGLQVGIALVSAAAPPNQPQLTDPQTLGVNVYLRDDGQVPIKIVDPSGAAGSNSPPQPTLWSIFTEPDHTAQIDHVRALPAAVRTLTPGEVFGFFVDMSPLVASRQGPHTVIAEYDNPDSVITVSLQPSKTESEVWTGQARSDEVQLNDSP